MAIRTTITGTQIKDETVDSADIASGSIKVGELSADAVSDQTAITSIDTSNDYLLIWDATDSALKKVAPANLGVGGSGSPGGSNAQVQYNNNSSFGGVSGVTTDGTSVTFGDTALLIGQDIIHDGDTDTYIRFTADAINVQAGGVDFTSITRSAAGTGSITFNDDGDDVNFIVESPQESKAIYLHSQNEVLHINHNESGFKTKIHSTHGEAITVNNNGVIFNDDGIAGNDFRIESNNDTHLFFADAGEEKIGIGTSSPSTILEVDGSVTVTGDLILDDGGSIKEASGTAAITIDSSGEVTKIGQDSPSSDQVLTWDGSKAVWSDASGGGGGGESSVSYTLGYATLNEGASGNVSDALTIPTGKTITIITIDVGTGFVDSYGSGTYASIYFKIGDIIFFPRGAYVAYSSVSEGTAFWGYADTHGSTSLRVATTSETDIGLYWTNQSSTLAAGSATVKAWYV